MLSFQQFLQNAAAKREAVNLMFEQRLFELVGVLHKIADPLMLKASRMNMKLSAFRDKDRGHIRSMDAAGVITPEVETALPGELRARLRHICETE